jgi:hypothetical protein
MLCIRAEHHTVFRSNAACVSSPRELALLAHIHPHIALFVLLVYGPFGVELLRRSSCWLAGLYGSAPMTNGDKG